MRSPIPRRAGFTLIEMMMAILLTMLVFAITVPFFSVQTQAVGTNAGRLDALQNARYAQNAIDRELRLAGGVAGQPIVVQAAPYAVTFNVDLVSRVLNDPNATYYNPSADPLSTESWDPANAKALPASTKIYPTQWYLDPNGNQSPAETISYFLYLDGTTGRNDLYVLYRRVNGLDSTVVARNLWIPTDTGYFFSYASTDPLGNVVAIPNASLPIYWDVPADTSIRVVNMRVAGLYRDAKRSVDVIRTIYASTKLINAGLLRQATCGSPPLPATNAVATQVLDPVTSNITKIHVTWAWSLEETGGEKDVAAYIIEKKLVSGTDWTTIANVPATGSSTYAYDDFGFQSGQWVYAIIAQDCSPSNSTAALTNTVTNP